MFIPCDDKLIPIGNVASAEIVDGKVQIVTFDGRSHNPVIDLESIEAMACPILKADPGYSRLSYGFVKGDFAQYPIVAWRVRTPYGLEPISFCDGVSFIPGIEAIQCPDGSIIVDDDDDDKTILSGATCYSRWEAYARQARKIWQKADIDE